MRPNEISYKAIGAAMAVHSALGAGLLESAYEKALCREFSKTGLQFQRQVPLGVTYSSVRIAPAYRIDFIIQGIVILDIKSVEKILPVHRAQVLSYLKLTGLPLGLVLLQVFGSARLLSSRSRETA